MNVSQCDQHLLMHSNVCSSVKSPSLGGRVYRTPAGLRLFTLPGVRARVRLAQKKKRTEPAVTPKAALVIIIDCLKYIMSIKLLSDKSLC